MNSKIPAVTKWLLSGYLMALGLGVGGYGCMSDKGGSDSAEEDAGEEKPKKKKKTAKGKKKGDAKAAKAKSKDKVESDD